MKLILLGDIHSNYMALERCLEYGKEIGTDGFIFLGDYISDCPYPQKTLRLLRETDLKYKTWFLRGNREDYQINYHDGLVSGWHYCSNSGSLLYTYENLREEDFKFFKSCNISMTVSISNMPDFTICHGSPVSTRELLHAGSPKADYYLRQCPTNILVCAHTHIQSIYKAYGKILINPGSVGIPVGSGGKTQFAILNGSNGEWTPEFVSLDYDIDKFLKEYKSSNLADKAKTFADIIEQEIRTGDNCLPVIFEKAKELTLTGEGFLNTGDMPDKYWEEAYQFYIQQLYKA